MGTSMENHRKMMEHDGTYPLLMEVYSWEDHRTKRGMFRCHACVCFLHWEMLGGYVIVGLSFLHDWVGF